MLQAKSPLLFAGLNHRLRTLIEPVLASSWRLRRLPCPVVLSDYYLGAFGCIVSAHVLSFIGCYSIRAKPGGVL